MQRIAGKIVGALLGFAVGGPMGAVIGFLLGHLRDSAAPARPRAFEAPRWGHPALVDPLEQTTFTLGVIVLGAKLAKADGRVSREEVAAFKRVFRVPPAQEREVGRLFDEARASAAGYEPYAARLGQVFRMRPHILEDILVGLFLIAAVEGSILSQEKSRFLRRIAVLFHFSENDFIRIAARAGVRASTAHEAPPRPAPATDDYATLGLQATATDEDIKRTYRALIRKHHPDRLAAQGLPPDQIAQATERMKRLNAAYDALCKARGMK